MFFAVPNATLAGAYSFQRLHSLSVSLALTVAPPSPLVLPVSRLSVAVAELLSSAGRRQGLAGSAGVLLRIDSSQNLALLVTSRPEWPQPTAGESDSILGDRHGHQPI